MLTNSRSLIMPVFSGYSFQTVSREVAFANHQHPSYQIILVDCGIYHCRLNRETMALPENHLLVVKPGDWHQDECKPPLRFFALNFSLSNTITADKPLSLFADGIQPHQQTAVADRAVFWPLLARMEEERDVADAISPMVQDALLREFFWRMVRAFPREVISPLFRQTSSDQAFTHDLQQLFQEHRRRQLTVRDMAEAMGVSERTLTNRCQMLLGEAPSHCFMRYKMEQAAAMLTQTGMPVKEISFYLGFSNPYHFSRAFKRHFGVSPSGMR